MSDQIMEWCRDVDIPLAGCLPFEPETVKAMVHGKSILEWNDQLPISRELCNIWKNIN
jgi:MinD superfamily P-loop ATPase